MLRLLICLLLTPVAALAQGAASVQKPPTTTPATRKPAAPATAAPKPLPAGKAPARTAVELLEIVAATPQ